MKVKITAIHPEDAFITGYTGNSQGLKPVIGLVGDFEPVDAGTMDGYTCGNFNSDELNTYFFAIQYKELPEERGDDHQG